MTEVPIKFQTKNFVRQTVKWVTQSFHEAWEGGIEWNVNQGFVGIRVKIPWETHPVHHNHKLCLALDLSLLWQI